MQVYLAEDREIGKAALRGNLLLSLRTHQAEQTRGDQGHGHAWQQSVKFGVSGLRSFSGNGSFERRMFQPTFSALTSRPPDHISGTRDSLAPTRHAQREPRVRADFDPASLPNLFSTSFQSTDKAVGIASCWFCPSTQEYSKFLIVNTIGIG